jgi:hypothetical protein
VITVQAFLPRLNKNYASVTCVLHVPPSVLLDLPILLIFCVTYKRYISTLCSNVGGGGGCDSSSSSSSSSSYYYYYYYYYSSSYFPRSSNQTLQNVFKVSHCSYKECARHKIVELNTVRVLLLGLILRTLIIVQIIMKLLIYIYIYTHTHGPGVA